MRLAFFTPSFLPKASGAEIFHHQLAERLVERGHEVVVVVPRKLARGLREGGWRAGYALDGFPGNVGSWLKRWPWLGMVWAGWHLEALQRRWGFDVWHGVGAFPCGVVLAGWATRRGVAHVVRTTGSDVISREGVGERLEGRVDGLVRRWLPRAGAVVALSGPLREELVRLGVREGAIWQIGNAVDAERVRPVGAEERQQLRRKLGLREGAFVFLAVGRYHAQKNYGLLLRAARSLEGCGEWQLMVAGREVRRLEGEVRELGLEGRVVCREFALEREGGRVAATPPQGLLEAYQAADAFVMASVLEGFSTAMLEAMAAGLAVVATDVPGSRELVRGEEEGWLVPAGDEAVLTEAMEGVMREEGRRRKLAEGARRRAEEFSWNRCVERYEGMYRELIRAAQG